MATTRTPHEARSVVAFKRHVDALHGMYYRLDTGRSGGRNSNSTAATLDAHMRDARALLAAELYADDAPLYDYLDAHPRFADKWNRVERRYFGCWS